MNSEDGPEVIIKVISPGSNNLKAIRLHLEKMQHGAGRVMETDQNSSIRTRVAARKLVEAWELDADERLYRHLKPVRAVARKIVHKILFSMPAGTPPQKLLLAVRAFARETFGREHRYALALHTDDLHPHVHVIVRAMKQSEVRRLNIRLANLREWRRSFARHLRDQGVPAKATCRKDRADLVRTLPAPLIKRPIWSEFVRKPDRFSIDRVDR